MKIVRPHTVPLRKWLGRTTQQLPVAPEPGSPGESEHPRSSIHFSCPADRIWAKPKQNKQTKKPNKKACLQEGRAKGHPKPCVSNPRITDPMRLPSVKSLYSRTLGKNKYETANPRPLLGCALRKTVAVLSSLGRVCWVLLSLKGHRSRGEERPAAGEGALPPWRLCS